MHFVHTYAIKYIKRGPLARLVSLFFKDLGISYKWLGIKNLQCARELHFKYFKLVGKK